MMLPLTLLRLPPLLTETTRHRLRRGMEGLSLWLAMAMMLFVHPLYAEASASDPELAGGCSCWTIRVGTSVRPWCWTAGSRSQ